MATRRAPNAPRGLTKVKNDKLEPDGNWRVAPGETLKGTGPEMSNVRQREEVHKALAEGKNVKAKVTVRAKDAAGNVATAKRTIKLVKGQRFAARGVMALGAQTAASAGLVKYDTSLDNGHTERCCLYHGSVESKVRKCERGRRVVLFRRQLGADRKVDHQRSDRDGNWGFVRRRRGGHFYAKATRERHEGKGFVCLAARAPNVTLGEVIRPQRLPNA